MHSTEENDENLAKDSSHKTKNIILINNSGEKPNNSRTQAPEDTFWLFGASKLPSFLGEAINRPIFAHNFNNTICPEYDKKKDYYKEFWRIYLQNEILLIDMKDSVVEIKGLQEQIAKVEEQLKSLENAKILALKEKGLDRKKNRRPASEIQKDHMCPYESCHKLYGSDVSLNLHIKLKHQGGNKTDREKLAISIVKAKLNGELPPQPHLNLPPGFLDMYHTQIADNNSNLPMNFELKIEENSGEREKNHKK